MIWIICLLYLFTIAGANLSIGAFGPWMIPFASFFLIPFDFVTRDHLHEKWVGKYLWPKMAALILSGSVLSFAINKDVKQIALASFVAFLVAGIVDTLVYNLLMDKKKFIKINISNLFSVTFDSILFPLIAFDLFSPSLTLTQMGLKFLGGIIWSLILLRYLFK